VAKILIRMQTKIPKAIRFNGYIKLARYIGQVRLVALKVVEEMTKAAQVDSANEPNKSALIPATSPTLSPTLSAIVAGFLGLSSGNPA
jgi:hypothetical protein